MEKSAYMCREKTMTSIRLTNRRRMRIRSNTCCLKNINDRWRKKKKSVEKLYCDRYRRVQKETTKKKIRQRYISRGPWNNLIRKKEWECERRHLRVSLIGGTGAVAKVNQLLRELDHHTSWSIFWKAACAPLTFFWGIWCRVV